MGLRIHRQQTLEEAREILRREVNLPGGTVCPCCDQHAQVYRRRLNHTNVRLLAVLARHYGYGWQHLPTVIETHLPTIAHQGGQITLGAHWGLIEEEAVLREDGGRAGWWRLTGKGHLWVTGEVTVPKYARLYNNTCLGLYGEQVSASEALSGRFDLRELMGWD